MTLPTDKDEHTTRIESDAQLTSSILNVENLNNAPSLFVIHYYGLRKLNALRALCFFSHRKRCIAGHFSEGF